MEYLSGLLPLVPAGMFLYDLIADFFAPPITAIVGRSPISAGLSRLSPSTPVNMFSPGLQTAAESFALPITALVGLRSIPA